MFNLMAVCVFARVTGVSFELYLLATWLPSQTGTQWVLLQNGVIIPMLDILLVMSIFFCIVCWFEAY
jgi:hypothetical protein